MIRNETFVNGVCVHAEIIDLNADTISFEVNGTVTSTRTLTAEERAANSPRPPTEAEKLDAARIALAALDGTPAPYTTADIVDVLLDVKTALGG